MLDNKAFALPTVTCFIIVLIGFCLSLTYNTLDSIKVSNYYFEEVKYDYALKKAMDIINNKIDDGKHTTCSLNQQDVEKDNTTDYKIRVVKYCLRRPYDGQVIPKESLELIEMFDTLLIDNGYISKVVFNEKEAQLLAIYILESSKEIIGPMMDINDFEQSLKAAGLGPEAVALSLADEVARRAEVALMDRYFIFNVSIEIQNNISQIMIVYNIEDKNFLKVYQA